MSGTIIEVLMRRSEPVQSSHAHVAGIRGQIVVTPQWPVGGANMGPPRQPPKSLRGRVRIETASASKENPGTSQLVALVDTDAGGKFSAELAPGRYVVTVLKEQPGYPIAKPAVVDVRAGVVTHVDVILDTGIR